MPTTNYNGNAANITNANTKTITATTNATPVQVTTSVAHGYFSNDQVFISGTGIAAINGSWVITVNGTNTFTLNSSSAPGSTSATGTVVDTALAPPPSIPLDGETFTMTTMGAVIQNLLDRTAFLNLNAMGMSYQGFSSSGTFTAPPGSTGFALVLGYGGGGGGGGDGSIWGGTASSAGIGGSGGAGARMSIQKTLINAGTSYTVTIGTGGTGGTAGSSAGADGGTTSFGTLNFAGGAGGAFGAAFNNTSTPLYLPGGHGPARGTRHDAAAFSSSSIPLLPMNYSDGGTAVCVSAGTTSFEGSPSVEGYTGGTGGAAGTAGGGNSGGGGGGGGGAGPGGVGAAGAAGGNNSSSAASPGSSAAANTGAGGGGGGAGGSGTITGSPGSNGGNGGSGYLLVFYSQAIAQV